MPTIKQFAEALAKLSSRTVRPADLSSAEWSRIPVQLRDRSFFSARTTHAQYLQSAKNTVQSLLDPKTVIRDGRPVTEGLDIATARLGLKDLLRSIGYSPSLTDLGTIKDLSSDARLNLLLTHNTKTAQGYGWHIQGQDPDLLDQWPAQELYRAEDRKEPRDWQVRWNGARGKLGDATTALDGRIRMAAIKNDPIWTEISAFDTPYPPFDFNSGMDVRDISRAEAEQLGLITADQQIKPETGDLNDELSASTAGLDGEFIAKLKKEFGDQVEIEGDTIRWTAADKPKRASITKPEAVISAASTETSTTPSVVEKTLAREEVKLAKRKGSEKMIVVDVLGKVVINRVGGKSSVGFSKADYHLMKDAVVTHNHPRGTAFSFEDVRAAQVVDCAEIRAVGVGQPYTYSLKRPASGWPSTMAGDYREISELVRRDYMDKIRSGEMTVDQASATHPHEVMTRLAATLQLPYERTQRI